MSNSTDFATMNISKEHIQKVSKFLGFDIDFSNISTSFDSGKYYQINNIDIIKYVFKKISEERDFTYNGSYTQSERLKSILNDIDDQKKFDEFLIETACFYIITYYANSYEGQQTYDHNFFPYVLKYYLQLEIQQGNSDKKNIYTQNNQDLLYLYTTLVFIYFLFFGFKYISLELGKDNSELKTFFDKIIGNIKYVYGHLNKNSGGSSFTDNLLKQSSWNNEKYILEYKNDIISSSTQTQNFKSQSVEQDEVQSITTQNNMGLTMKTQNFTADDVARGIFEIPKKEGFITKRDWLYRLFNDQYFYLCTLNPAYVKTEENISPLAKYIYAPFHTVIFDDSNYSVIYDSGNLPADFEQSNPAHFIHELTTHYDGKQGIKYESFALDETASSVFSKIYEDMAEITRVLKDAFDNDKPLFKNGVWLELKNNDKSSTIPNKIKLMCEYVRCYNNYINYMYDTYNKNTITNFRDKYKDLYQTMNNKLKETFELIEKQFLKLIDKDYESEEKNQFIEAMVDLNKNVYAKYKEVGLQGPLGETHTNIIFPDNIYPEKNTKSYIADTLINDFIKFINNLKSDESEVQAAWLQLNIDRKKLIKDDSEFIEIRKLWNNIESVYTFYLELLPKANIDVPIIHGVNSKGEASKLSIQDETNQFNLTSHVKEIVVDTIKNPEEYKKRNQFLIFHISIYVSYYIKHVENIGSIISLLKKIDEDFHALSNNEDLKKEFSIENILSRIIKSYLDSYSSKNNDDNLEDDGKINQHNFPLQFMKVVYDTYNKLIGSDNTNRANISMSELSDITLLEKASRFLESDFSDMTKLVQLKKKFAHLLNHLMQIDKTFIPLESAAYFIYNLDISDKILKFGGIVSLWWRELTSIIKRTFTSDIRAAYNVLDNKIQEISAKSHKDTSDTLQSLIEIHNQNLPDDFEELKTKIGDIEGNTIADRLSLIDKKINNLNNNITALTTNDTEDIVALKPDANSISEKALEKNSPVVDQTLRKDIDTATTERGALRKDIDNATEKKELIDANVKRLQSNIINMRKNYLQIQLQSLKSDEVLLDDLSWHDEFTKCTRYLSIIGYVNQLNLEIQRAIFALYDLKNTNNYLSVYHKTFLPFYEILDSIIHNYADNIRTICEKIGYHKHDPFWKEHFQNIDVNDLMNKNNIEAYKNELAEYLKENGAFNTLRANFKTILNNVQNELSEMDDITNKQLNDLEIQVNNAMQNKRDLLSYKPKKRLKVTMQDLHLTIMMFDSMEAHYSKEIHSLNLRINAMMSESSLQKIRATLQFFPTPPSVVDSANDVKLILDIKMCVQWIDSVKNFIDQNIKNQDANVEKDMEENSNFLYYLIIFIVILFLSRIIFN